MDNILHLEMGSGNCRAEFRKRNSTPEDIGNSLFQSMLTQKEKSSGEELFGISLFIDKGSTKNSLSLNKTEGKSDPIQKLDKMIHHLGFLHTQILLPDSAIPQIVSLLKGQGFSTEKINQLIMFSKNKDGFLRLDKLLARLMDSSEVLNHDENSTGIIRTSQVPNVEEILFKLGFGAGEVKTAIEKSINQKGELLLGKLSAEIERFFPGFGSRSELITLMEQNGINLKQQIPDRGKFASNLKTVLTRILQLPPQDLQKTVKQNMASLLKEKGIPTQEVKSFLEKIEVDLSGTETKGARTIGFEQEKLLNLAFLKNTFQTRKQEWNQRILTILQNEKILNTQGVNLYKSPEGEDLKLNLANLLNHGGQKIHPDLLIKAHENEGQFPHGKAMNRLDKGLQDFQIKELTGTEQAFQKVSREIQGFDGTNQTKNNLNLPLPLPKILDRMVWMIRAGEQRSRMVIHPPELGRLDLSIAVKSGHLQANLNAESPMVKEIIEANLNHLKQQLTEQGLIVEKFEVMVGLNDKQFRDETLWDWKGRKTPSRTRKADMEGEDRVIKGTAGYFSDNPNKIDVLV